MEFDTPQALLSDANSQFSSFVKQTGSGEAEYLRSIVNGANSNDPQYEETAISNEMLLDDGSETDSLL